VCCCHCFLCRAGDRVDGVPGQRDRASGYAGYRVVADFERERFEQPAGCLVERAFQINCRYRQVVEQGRVVDFLRLLPGCGDLAFQVVPVGVHLGAALLDVL
jgi:hypothetical protein